MPSPAFVLEGRNSHVKAITAPNGRAANSLGGAGMSAILRAADGRCRRIADVADRVIGRLNWGGERAYERRLGKDRSARQSRHSIASGNRLHRVSPSEEAQTIPRLRAPHECADAKTEKSFKSAGAPMPQRLMEFRASTNLTSAERIRSAGTKWTPPECGLSAPGRNTVTNPPLAVSVWTPICHRLRFDQDHRLLGHRRDAERAGAFLLEVLIGGDLGQNRNSSPLTNLSP